ncbi:MAG: hypothetical protein M3367_08030 [Acidobacteriota bacterium]|nr:hypothetical protein [Acidobacteriota bacterium]
MNKAIETDVALVLRPDNHVGFIPEEISTNKLKSYPALKNVFKEEML